MSSTANSSESNLSYKYPAAAFLDIDGIKRPYATRENIECIAKLPVQEGDIFVAGYPKSGTTWLCEIVWQILNGGIIDHRHIEARAPVIDDAFFTPKKLKLFDTENMTLLDIYRNRPHPRVFKIHFQYRLVPKGEGSAPKPKYIYVLRNPKDCAVSFYHHHRRTGFYEFTHSWEEFYKLWMSRDVAYGSWFDHVLGWWEHRDDPNILFLKYEDMKKDLPNAVRQIAEFVGKDMSVEMVQRIADQTSFDVMKNGKQFYQDETGRAAVYSTRGESKFVRKGVVGDWRNYFTDEQSRRFDEWYTKEMAGSGLELEFE